MFVSLSLSTGIRDRRVKATPANEESPSVWWDSEWIESEYRSAWSGYLGWLDSSFLLSVSRAIVQTTNRARS